MSPGGKKLRDETSGKEFRLLGGRNAFCGEAPSPIGQPSFSVKSRLFARRLQNTCLSFLTLALGSHRWGVDAMSRKAPSAQRKDRVVNGDASEKGKLVCFATHNSVLLTSYLQSPRINVPAATPPKQPTRLYDSKSIQNAIIAYAKDASTGTLLLGKRSAQLRTVNKRYGNGTGGYRRSKIYRSSVRWTSGKELCLCEWCARPTKPVA